MKHGGITLRDRGFMKQSIVGVQTGPDEVTVGSALTVGSGWNLLGIHEFGAMIHRTVKPGAVKLRTDARGELLHREGTNLAIFASPLHKRYRSVAFEGGKEYTIRIPRRPTSPFDWDRGELTPHAAKLATDMVGNYMVGLAT